MSFQIHALMIGKHMSTYNTEGGKN